MDGEQGEPKKIMLYAMYKSESVIPCYVGLQYTTDSCLRFFLFMFKTSP